MIRVAGMLAVFVLGCVPAWGNGQRSFPPEVQARLQKVLDELQEVEEKLRPIRRQAEQSEELQEIRNGIQNDLLAQVKDNHGEMADKVGRIEDLQRQLAKNRRETPQQNDARRSELRAELSSLENELHPLIREIRKSPEFSERIDAYANRLETAMLATVPEAEKLLARRDALHIQFHRLQREALEAVRGEDLREEDIPKLDDTPSLNWVTPPARNR